jgi:outer membrane protein assembly factor BamB
VIRRIAVILALAGLVAAGCGAEERAAEKPRAVRLDGPVLTWRETCRRTVVVVTVVNGDTHRPVRRARVDLGGRKARTNRRGVAEIPVRCRRSSWVVTVRARGYRPKAERRWFVEDRKVTVSLYRPELQWPIYGADPARTHAQTEIDLRPPFRIVWTRGLGSLIEFPAVVSEGVAFIGNYGGTIRAISMETGKVAWRTDLRAKMASSVAVVGEEVIVHTMDGNVSALDRRNGKVLWRVSVGSPIESSPIVYDGIDYFGTWSGVVYALDVRRRRLLWTYRSGAKITASAAVSGRTLFIGDYGGRVLALATRTGRLRWARRVGGRVYGTPAVGGGRVFVPSSTGGSLTAFSVGGRYLWRIGTGSYVYSSPAYWAGRVYFGSYNGRLYAASAARGRVLWTVSAGGPISGAAVVVAGVVYAGSTANRIVGADARSGRVLLRFPHGEYVPVSGNGRLLLLHGYSRLYAVEPR